METALSSQLLCMLSYRDYLHFLNMGMRWFSLAADILPSLPESAIEDLWDAYQHITSLSSQSVGKMVMQVLGAYGKTWLVPLTRPHAPLTSLSVEEPDSPLDFAVQPEDELAVPPSFMVQDSEREEQPPITVEQITGHNAKLKKAIASLHRIYPFVLQRIISTRLDAYYVPHFYELQHLFLSYGKSYFSAKLQSRDHLLCSL